MLESDPFQVSIKTSTKIRTKSLRMCLCKSCVINYEIVEIRKFNLTFFLRSVNAYCKRLRVVPFSEFKSFLKTNSKKRFCIFSDLEHFEGTDQVQHTETLLIDYASVDPNAEISTLEVADVEKLTKQETDLTKGKEVVSQLAMEWEDEDELQSNST